jgi:hypothetical protein
MTIKPETPVPGSPEWRAMIARLEAKFGGEEQFLAAMQRIAEALEEGLKRRGIVDSRGYADADALSAAMNGVVAAMDAEGGPTLH